MNANEFKIGDIVIYQGFNERVIGTVYDVLDDEHIRVNPICSKFRLYIDISYHSKWFQHYVPKNIPQYFKEL